MQLNKLKPRKALNKAWLKVKPSRTEIEGFKTNLIQLIHQTNETESEEFHKNLVSDFLKKTYYDRSTDGHNHFINTKGRNDLVIHNGETAQHSVGVIIETKKPTNKTEMVTTEKLNTKALHELLLYYLRERIAQKNLEIKYLIATNIYEWFVFDANIFEKNFAVNKKLVQQFEDFEGGRLAGKTTDFFYREIAEPFIAAVDNTIEFTHFDLRDYDQPLRNDNPEDDHQLIALFKLLSPEHLLKLPFANDSNSLDRKFYSELLHIIGLTETKEGGKKIIQRNDAGKRNTGSLLENAIIQLDALDKIHRLENPSQYGDTKEEQLFNVGLELSITWVNRILFLKLLEAQLIAYHKGDLAYSFLNFEKINNYDDLNSLFFQVLAKKHEERNEDVMDEFAKVPYLNSSLFEPNELEHNTILISNLRDEKTLPILSGTVLKDDMGKKRKGKLNALAYFFAFLEAYDFSSEGSAAIQEDHKTLINAAVLGLIFEKINGYKDGSFFTPGFITMYMCRETLRRAVVQKFNDTKGWNCKNLDDLYDKIENRTEANQIINSLKICDPAVGSGHFLVSALNELIAIKYDLKILQDRDGRRLKEYTFEVVNDELIVTDEDGELFEYTHTHKEAQRVQETLFHEKQTLIENCLFGVDINPNSVKICRLRLWIELLKNAYYKNETELETLPNIDINIKCGNSLISRFDLEADLGQALKKGKGATSRWSIDSYRIAVASYRNAQSKAEKYEMERLIRDIKSDFRSEMAKNDPKLQRLYKLNGELANLTTQTSMFEMSKKEKTNWNKKVEKLSQAVQKLEAEIADIKNNKIYENAFEWRFEFPEVLNDEGDFVGFDAVIGNPPYIRQEEVKEFSNYFQAHFSTFSGKSDIYVYFYELAVNILGNKNSFSFITSSKFFEANYGKPLVDYLFNSVRINEIINFNDLPVFEDATAYPVILTAVKEKQEDFKFKYYDVSNLPSSSSNSIRGTNSSYLECTKKIFRDNDGNFINKKTAELIAKTFKNSLSLDAICGLPIVGVKTGFNDGFISDTNFLELKKPYVFGRDIKKYRPVLPKNEIIFPYDESFQLVDIQGYPNSLNMLEKHKDKLSKRAIIKEGIIKGNRKWFEYQQVNKSVNYDEEYIIYPNVSLGNNFSLTTGSVIDMTGFIIKSNSKFLLGILNSKLIEFLMSIWAIGRRGGYLEYKVQYVQKIPIKKISGKGEETGIESLVTQILALKKENPEADTTALEAEIDRLVYELYDLTEEEIAIVENAVK